VIRQAAEDDAHDLKSPLALIKVAHKRARRALAANDIGKGLLALEAADDAVDRMLVSIDISQRLAEQTAELAIAPRSNCSLMLAVETCRCALASAIELRKARVTVRYSEDIAVSTEGRLLEGLLCDVLRNAIESSTEGGEIFVTLGLENGKAAIAVSDEGVGIDSNSRGMLFVREPLTAYATELPGRAPRRYFIAKRNADLLGGAITIDNRPTGGVLAVVHFPACMTFATTKIARGDH
jgi:two-component system, OmpR family, sensor histidine kinase ChvG